MKLLESKNYIKDIEKALHNCDLSQLDGKTIFITGGLGLICSAIVDVIITYGKTGIVYVGARNIEQFKERYDGYKNVEYIEYDAMAPLCVNFDIDYIIHGAGVASPELYTAMPVETILSNFDGVHNLLEFAKINNVKRLLYISSSEVYGAKTSVNAFKEGTYGEIDIDKIRSSYSVAKRASEMLCKAYCTEFDVDTVIVRPGHIYGPSAKKSDKRISSDFAFKAANGNNLIMKSTGLQKRSYCYSIDCAIQILTALLKGANGQAYNIGHDEVTTIKEMAEILAKSGNVELFAETPSEEEKKAFNPMNNSSLDNSKVKALGYRDTFTVEEGLRHTVEILREIT